MASKLENLKALGLRVLIAIFGVSWKTTLVGYVQLFLTTLWEGYQASTGKLTSQDLSGLIISAGLAVGLRFAKDHNVTNSPAAILPPVVIK